MTITKAVDSMLNLGAYRPLPENSYCYHKVFLQLFLPFYWFRSKISKQWVTSLFDLAVC